MRGWLGALFLASALSLASQAVDGSSINGESRDAESVARRYGTVRRWPDDLRQELDVDAAALSRIPADPLLKRDALARLFGPVNRAADKLADNRQLKFDATYTILTQYATETPEGEHLPRRAVSAGRLDLTGAWRVYQRGSTAGSVSVLVRSGTNIGVSQQFNLSDRLGSGLYLNCLQGGGPQEPITLNVLYWRQDLFHKRLSLYAGKIHPNEFVSLSLFNNDERTQFLNGAEDGNLAVASDGAYAGGAAVEFQATPHFYVHALAVDTEGAQQRGLGTLVDRKYAEGFEVGWFSGSPGEQYRNYRAGFWRNDTKSAGSGFGGGLGFEHEFPNGWTPFGRFGFATNEGTAIKQVHELGVAHVQPFGRRGDAFGLALNYTVPTHAGKHHESLIETFYRLRLTQSVEIGPDLEVSIHPTYASNAYTTALLGMRMRILF